ncbi:Acetyltransferase (GNAT) family protein [Paraburkholderia steynii]|uniref:Acetyltransferase (GNAT) family protein n=1 Tax=Paraburkholderia steynii TaxID=1245441 RepID=A0A7Z7B3M1_9BURK|nr:GNAT family N-acetyltransferase [Paraburkholderia steynii]SDH23999.1 Acetyltransferase (GNAT) family protein [Paraburkholderia steynii]
MRIELTDSPDARDEAFVIAQTRAFNAAFTKEDVRPLSVFIRDGEDRILGGLTAKTYWEYLEIQFLWIDESHRANGLASDLMTTAEKEAANRGCKHVFLDTLSFQALGFYEKLGYSEFGRLEGFSGRHDRHFLHKSLEHLADVQR